MAAKQTSCRDTFLPKMTIKVVTNKDVPLSTTSKHLETKNDLNTLQRIAVKHNRAKNKLNPRTLYVSCRSRGKLNTSQASNTGDAIKLDHNVGQNNFTPTRSRSPAPATSSWNRNQSLVSHPQSLSLDMSADRQPRNPVRLYPFSDASSGLSVMNFSLSDRIRTSSVAFLPAWPSHEDTEKLYSCQEHNGVMTQLYRNQANRKYYRKLSDYMSCCLSEKWKRTHYPVKAKIQMPMYTKHECILCDLYSYNYETTTCPPNSPVAPADGYTGYLLETDTDSDLKDNLYV